MNNKSHYTILSKCVSWTRLLKIKNKTKSVVFTNKVRKNSQYFEGVVNKTIIPIARVRYEMT